MYSSVEPNSPAPTKAEITPPTNQEKGRFETDSGDKLEFWTGPVTRWLPIFGDGSGTFYPTKTETEALDVEGGIYFFRIEKSTKPNRANVKAYSFGTGVIENSFFYVP